MDKIKFVRQYDSYGEKWTEVVYKTNRLVTYGEHIPKTVQEYIDRCNKRTEQYDKIFKRTEVIFEKQEETV